MKSSITHHKVLKETQVIRDGKMETLALTQIKRYTSVNPAISDTWYAITITRPISPGTFYSEPPSDISPTARYTWEHRRRPTHEKETLGMYRTKAPALQCYERVVNEMEVVE